MIKIPKKEPAINRIVPRILPFLRKKLTMLAERIPKPRIGSADRRISPTSPKDMIFFNGTMVRQGGLDVKRDYQLFFVKG